MGRENSLTFIILSLRAIFAAANGYGPIDLCPASTPTINDSVVELNLDPDDTSDAIDSATVVDKVDKVFYPGHDVLELSISQGLPCVVACRIISDECEVAITIPDQILEKSENHEVSVSFGAPGLYRVSCLFKNRANAINSSRTIVVSQRIRPVQVDLKTDKAIPVGGDARVSIALGILWFGVKELSGNSQVFWVDPDGKYHEDESQRFEFTNIFMSATFNYQLSRIGNHLLRINLFLRSYLTVETMYLQYVLPLPAVKDKIEHILVLAICKTIDGKSETVHIDRPYVEELLVPIDSTVMLNSSSRNMVTQWTWMEMDQVLSRTNQFEFVTNRSTEITISAKNEVSQLRYSFRITWYAPMEELILHTNTTIIGVGEAPEFHIIFTSLHVKEQAQNGYMLSITILDSDAIVAVPEKDEQISNESQICRAVEERPIHVQPFDGLNNKHAVMSVCEYRFSYTFKRYTSYDVTAKIKHKLSHEYETNNSHTFFRSNLILMSTIKVCVSGYVRCRPPVVTITNPKLNGIIQFEYRTDVTIIGNYLPRECSDDYFQAPSELRFSWEIIRLLGNNKDGRKDSLAPDETWPMIVADGLEFFRPSESAMPVGVYKVTLLLQESDYCGDQAATIKDSALLEITPGPLNPEILGGSKSVIYILPNSILTLVRANSDHPEMKEVRWSCQRRIGGTGRQVQSLRSSNMGCFRSGLDIDFAIYNDSEINIPLESLSRIPDTVAFTLTYLGIDEQKYSTEQILYLRESSHTKLELLESLQYKSLQPRVLVICISNCGSPSAVSNFIRLRADCEPCRIANSTQIQLQYRWNVFRLEQGIQYDLPGHLSSLVLPSKQGYPDFRMMPDILKKAGQYRILAKMEAVRAGSERIEIGRSYYDINIPDAPVPPSCFIRPSQGIAMVTKFKLVCVENDATLPNMYELYYSVCHDCEQDTKRYMLFNRGYESVYRDLMFPVGDPDFGFTLSIKVTVRYTHRMQNDVFLVVAVKPPGSGETEDILTKLISQGNGISRNDPTGFVRTATTALSLTDTVADDELKLKTVESILQKIRTVDQSSPNGIRSTSQVLTKSMGVLDSSSVSDAVIISNLGLVEDTVSSQISHILSKNTSRGTDDSAAPDVVGTIVEGIRLATSVKYSNVSILTGRFESSLESAIMGFSANKMLGEKATEIRSDRFQLNVALQEVEFTETIVRQQTGLLLGRGAKVSGRYKINSGVMTFFFNPSKRAENKEDVNIVVDVVLNSTAESGDNLPVERVDILLPISADANLQMKPVSLPPPCGETTQSYSTLCGAIKADIQIRLPMSDSEKSTLSGGVYVILTPKFACRLPRQPCINATFQVAQPTADESCNLNGSNCGHGHRILARVSFPIVHKEPIADEFRQDPWALKADEQLARVLSKKDSRLTVILEYLQTYLSSDDDFQLQDVRITIRRVTCLQWNKQDSTWSSDVCRTRDIVVGNKIHCSCTLSKATPRNSAGGGKNKGSTRFASSVIIVPNQIVVGDIASIISRMQTRFYVITLMTSVCVAFIAGYVITNRKDQEQKGSLDIVIPPGNSPHNDYLYEVVVITAALRGAGTSAKVTMILEGENGSRSDPQIISNSDHSTLQRAGRDSFLVPTSGSLGQVDAIHLSHDNTGNDPAWHVNGIVVFDLHDESRKPSYFVINSWISFDIYPYRCSMVAKRSTAEEITSFAVSWRLHATDFLNTRDAWWTFYFKARRSVFSYRRRLTCLACAFFGSMLVTNMFIEAESQYYVFKLGYVDIDLSPLIIAIESTLITLPIGFIHRRVFNGIAKKGEAEVDRLISLAKSSVSDTDTSMNQSSDFRLDDRRFGKQSKSLTTKVSSGIGSEDFDMTDTLQDFIEIRRIAKQIMDECKQITPNEINRRNVKVTVGGAPVASELEGIIMQESDLSLQRRIFDRLFVDRFMTFIGRGKTDKEQDFDNICSVDKDFGEDYANLHGIQETNLLTDDRSKFLRGVVFLPRQFMIPAWLNSLVWVITVLYVILCLVLSLIYAVSYDTKMFLSWLTTFVISIVQNIFIVSPLKVSIIAAIRTMFTRSVDHNLWVPHSGSVARAEAVIMWRLRRTRIGRVKRTRFQFRSSQDRNTVTPHAFGDSLANATSKTRYAIAVRQVKDFCRDSVGRVLLAVFVSLLIYNQFGREFERSNTVLTRKLSNSVGHIKSCKGIFSFLNDDFLPIIFETEETAEMSPTIPLGTMRFRQLRRIHRKRCACIHDLESCDCIGQSWYNIPYDEENYADSWMPTNDSAQTKNPWAYNAALGTQESWLPPGTWSELRYLVTGGYVVDSAHNIEEIRAILRSQEHLGWIDNRTLIFTAEFSTLSLPTGYVTSHITVVECLSSGSARSSHQSNSYRPVYFYSGKDIIIVCLQVCHIIINFIQIYGLIAKCWKAKWHALAVLDLCSDLWSVLDIISFTVTIVTYVFYIYHVMTFAEASTWLRNNPSGFVSFSKPAYHKIMFMNLSGLCVYLNYLRLLKITRGSEALSHITDLIKKSRAGVISCTLSFMTLITVFSMTGRLITSMITWSEGHIVTPLMDISYLAVLGKLKPPNHAVIEDISSRIYFYAAVICISILHANLIVVVLLRTFKASEKLRRMSGVSRKAETVAVRWIYENVCRIIGVKSKAFSGKSVRLRIPPGTILHRRPPQRK